MKYLVIDNFIEQDTCNLLIQDVDKFVKNSKLLTVNINRQALFSSSLEFGSLVEKSEHWKKFTQKINSNDFLNFCKKKLNIDEKLYLTNFFKIENPSRLEKLYKSISNEKVKSAGTYTLAKYFAFRLYRDLLRKVKFSKIFNLKKIPVELLYDYSKAGNGYFREIHRDSDSRVIVFLLYLNSLSDQTKGGTLDIFKLKKGENENLAQPNKSMCEKIESVEPKPGRLVIFKNDNTSYHSVEKLNNSKDSRCFIYGGFTSLSQNNPFITQNNLETIFSNYE